MRQLDFQVIASRLNTVFSHSPAPDFSPALEIKGAIVEVNETIVKAWLPWGRMGELCYIEPDNLPAEVVALKEGYAFLSLFDAASGLRYGQPVRATGNAHQIAVGDFLPGRAVDGLGRLLNSAALPESGVEWRTLQAPAPEPFSRKMITEPLSLGVRAIDSLLTCGMGQRVGIFAAAGGGKSSLLSMLCEGSSADVMVLALVGERGREVREFVEHTLTTEARQRCVMVVATSERPALERLKASYTATVIAEYFRDQGKNVLLMVDSLTRYARAAREVGLACGEPPVASGYPPSVFASLPRLLERAGMGEKGSITGIYTVLVEGDNLNEPISDEVRSLLDGHIILSRKLAEAHHYPAIDIGASISRVMRHITTVEHQQLARRFRRLAATYQDIEFLVRVGEFKKGEDLNADEAFSCWPLMQHFLRQSPDDRQSFTETLSMLETVLKETKPC